MRKFILAAACLFITAATHVAIGQDTTPVRFSFVTRRLNEGEMMLRITAVAEPGVRLYALQQGVDDAAYSELNFDSLSRQRTTGSVIETGHIILERDSVLGGRVRYVNDSISWIQKISATPSDSFDLKGSLSYMYCKAHEYTPDMKPFRVSIRPAKPTLEKANGWLGDKSLLWIFLAAFGGGLLSLLTPCVYSMIPITVSFFTKRSESRKQGVRNAVYYAVSIVAIFTLFGFLLTLLFGPAALNKLSTNWIANLVFFALFFLFGISFLGAFDIRLPSSWSTRADSKAGLANSLSIFFMALTLVLVSFSCTGPIIGNLLVLAAQGSYWGPLVGMFGFSTALALPFALFAFFPSALQVLGKAGGWLNAVKVTLGFLELALALKFFSNVDLAMGWRLLDREIFIACWIAIFLLLTLYLLGKLKFHHDDELPRNSFGLPYLRVTRLLFALTALGFVVYMVPGLWGAPLKGVSAFLPPMGTQDFIAGGGGIPGNGPGVKTSQADNGRKYAERMKMYEPEVVTRYGIATYFDYQEALAVSRKLHKPLMLDFTGINCVNCRKMESQVWSDPAVLKRLQDDFVIASLYVDAQQVELPDADRYFSQTLGKQVETLGERNADLQVTKFGANTQPYYFFLDGEEKMLHPQGYGYDPDVKRFVNLLGEVKNEFERR